MSVIPFFACTVLVSLNAKVHQEPYICSGIHLCRTDGCSITPKKYDQQLHVSSWSKSFLNFLSFVLLCANVLMLINS